MALFERYRKVNRSEGTVSPIPAEKPAQSGLDRWYGGAKTAAKQAGGGIGAAVKGAVNGAKDGYRTEQNRAKLERWQRDIDTLAKAGLTQRQYMRHVLAEYEQEDRKRFAELEEATAAPAADAPSGIEKTTAKMVAHGTSNQPKTRSDTTPQEAKTLAYSEGSRAS